MRLAPSLAPLLSLLLLTVPPVPARPPASAPDSGPASVGAVPGEVLLQRALDLADLGAPGVPFRLTASVVVHGEFRGQRTGTYELTWLEPGEWSETWRLEGYVRTRATHDSVLALAREPECPPERADWPALVLAWHRAPRLRAGDRVLRVKERAKKGLTCAVVDAAIGVRREECVDDGGILRRIELGDWLLDFDGDVPWHGRHHPRHLMLRDGGHRAVEIEVTAIEAAPEGATVRLPEGAPTWPGGPDRVPPALQSAPLTYPPMAARFERSGLVVVHGTVGADGRAAAATLACSSGDASLDGQLLKAVERWRWAPARVGGQPVASPFAMEVDFRVERRPWWAW